MDPDDVWQENNLCITGHLRGKSTSYPYKGPITGFEIKGSGGTKCSIIAPKYRKVAECKSKVLVPI